MSDKNIPGILMGCASVFLIILIVHVSDGNSASYRGNILFRHVILAGAAALPLLSIGLRKVRWGAADAVLAGLIGIYCISAIANGRDISQVAMQELFPYVVLYMVVKIYVCTCGRPAMFFLFLAICLWSCAESVTGLAQVFGKIHSGHQYFGMTGSFSNPGPYGCFMAMTMAPAAGYLLRHRKSMPSGSMTVLSVMTLALGITVLPASGSRAGWLGLIVAVMVAIVIETGFRLWLRRHLWILSLILPVILSTSYGIYAIKKDSALGRLHLWNIEARAIADAPLAGSGPGTFAGSYGTFQELYFRSGDRPEKIVRVAGCPEHAFNEYLGAGMECGVLGLLFSGLAPAVAVTALIRRRSILAYGLVSAAVSAFFSYPLSVVPVATCITMLLGAGSDVPSMKANTGSNRAGYISPVLTIVAVLLVTMGIIKCQDVYDDRAEAVSEWQNTRRLSEMGLYEKAADPLGQLYERLSWSYRYLFDYGYALHKIEEYEKSNEILREGAMISSDPMFHNIIGKNYQAIGHYGEAEKAYMKSHYMVPCRIYPLVLLMEMYMETGEYEKAMETGNQILGMPVNPKNRAMAGLRKEVEDKMEAYEAMR